MVPMTIHSWRPKTQPARRIFLDHHVNDLTTDPRDLDLCHGHLTDPQERAASLEPAEARQEGWRSVNRLAWVFVQTRSQSVSSPSGHPSRFRLSQAAEQSVSTGTSAGLASGGMVGDTGVPEQPDSSQDSKHISDTTTNMLFLFMIVPLSQSKIGDEDVPQSVTDEVLRTPGGAVDAPASSPGVPHQDLLLAIHRSEGSEVDPVIG